MKKEYSFYEFVAIIVPGALFLFSINTLISINYPKYIIEYTKIGGSFIFILLSYGAGHLIQSFGNFFESIVWGILKKKPTDWIFNKNIFNRYLFDKRLNEKLQLQLKSKFGDSHSNIGQVTYIFLFEKGKTSRIDIFNGNYSLYRGLSVTFLLLLTVSYNLVTIKIILILLAAFFLSTIRMYRFANYYAKEIFLTFMIISESSNPNHTNPAH